MAKRKLQVFDHYHYGKQGILRPGDRFRVNGGPVYVTDDGRLIPMYERGQFIFRAYCIRGRTQWLEAYRADGGGIAILSVAKTHRSRVVPNLRCRPYRVTGKARGSVTPPTSSRGRKLQQKRNPRDHDDVA
jgi:hypothetical protein